MAGLRKDVELIFRGEDRASPTIKSVRNNVRDLRKVIDEQIAAADRGEGSIDDLTKAYKRLGDVKNDVGEITKLAAAYEKLSAKLAEQSAKVDQAREKQQQLDAQVAAAEAPTKRLQNARDAAGRSLQAAISKEEQYKNELLQLGGALDAAGGDSKNFAVTQDRIKQAAIETARAIRDAAAAMDQFKGKQSAAKASTASQSEAAQFNALAAGSGLPQAQIQFISGLENRLQALQTAIREDQASMVGLNAELRDKAAAEASARISAMAAALDEADQKAERLKVTAQFRSMAAEIEANAREIGRFGNSADTAATSGQRLAQTLDAILNPTQAVARTMDGVNATIDASEAVLTGAKRRMSEYNAEINNLQAAMAGLQDMARLVDSFRQQEAAVAGAQAEFDAAQTKVIGLAQAMRTAQAPTQEMATELKQAESNLERLGATLGQETAKLNSLKTSMAAAKIDTNNLAQAEQHLTTAATRAAKAQGALRAKTGGKGNFLGLQPYELQNLGFQVNDVVTGLISGQKPLTVFAQQGLQIGQIIPGAFTKIVRFAPELAALAAVVLSVAGAMHKLDQEAANLDMGKGIAAQTGASKEAAAAYADLAGKLEALGVKADKTREILVQLSADGLNTAQMEQYIATAEAVSKVTGEDIPTALETVRGAFQGGLDDIIALDDKTNAYTDDEIALISQLYEHGQADEARATALEIYRRKQEEVANGQSGPWSRAVDQLSQAWNNFLSFLGHLAPIETVYNWLNKLGQLAAYVAARLAGKSNEDALKVAAGSYKPKTPAVLPDPNRRTNAGNQQAKDDALALATLKATTWEQRKALVIQKARNEAAAKHLSDIEIEEHVQRSLAVFNEQEDQKEQKRAAASSKRGDAAAKRRQRQAEAQARQIASMEEQLQGALDQLDAKVAKSSTELLQMRLSAIDKEYAKLFRKIDEYSKKTGGKGMIGGLTLDQAREHVKQQEQALKNLATEKYYEEQLNNLAEQRAQKLSIIADEVARGTKSPTQGLAESQQVIDDYATKMADIAQSAVTFAVALRGAKPDPALEAFIAKMQNVSQQNMGGTNQGEKSALVMGDIEKQQAILNQIVSQRNAMIDLENTKVQLGLETQKKAQENINQLYANSKPLILQHIEAIRTMAAAYNGTLTPEMQQYFDALEANLKGTELEAQGVDARFTELKSSIDQLLTSNIVDFIKEVAQAFADWASGGKDVLDTLASIGIAFLDMIAKTLIGIGELIVQMVILDAIQSITGIPVKALLQLYGGVSPGVHHEGGVVGEGSSRRSRMISPVAFANAPRYHTGGIAGLAPNETTAILKKGEEVLTNNDPRHRNNGGLQPQGGKAPQSIRQVLAIGDDEIANAMAGAAGESTVLTHIKRNKTTIKTMLDNA